MTADDIIGLIVVLAILILIISFAVAITVLALTVHKYSSENVKLRLEVEQLKNSPKYSVPDTPSEYEMPRSFYERPYEQGFEQHQ